MPNTHTWLGIPARKEKKKGKACGGMMIGKKKNWGKEEDTGKKIEEGIVVSKIEGVERGKGLFYYINLYWWQLGKIGGGYGGDMEGR